ncbi:hypothetical protein LTR78_010461 [Recurvomyces mirabilis]|uniref:Uncharacterized protein n=1 Tax=Recurvomyces mirabilis TaxID=574656 RepID=A0AAE0TMB0_9PEZI|nr:hypothetical protein LTR78_010461 [Recurvomyces mirabilis]KAK5150354.1 hypothetical protein LTS14_010193 [Recurvomyces mirabilis]
MAVWLRRSRTPSDLDEALGDEASGIPPPSSPAPRPDCLLLLRDGTMQPAYRDLIQAWLEDASIIAERYTLPVYEMPHNVEAIQIWLALQEGTLSVDCETPTVESLLDLARLCTSKAEIHMARQQIQKWLGEHLESPAPDLTADVLEIALLCGSRSDVVDACRALVVGRVSHAEVERADSLLGLVPPPMRIATMRAKLQDTIRLYTMNGFEDHPFYRSTSTDRHICPAKAMELALYARALHTASCFPFPDDCNSICLHSALSLFAKQGTHTVHVQTCTECSYVCRGRQLGLLPIIARTINGMCKTYMSDFERYMAHLPTM